MSSYSSFTTESKLLVMLAHLLVVDQRVVLQPRLQLVQDHERVDRPLLGERHQRVRDLVLHVPRADAVHPLALGLLAQLLDVVLGEPGQRLAVVELQLLQAASAPRSWAPPAASASAHIAATSSV